jgi:hypothetical protein
VTSGWICSVFFLSYQTTLPCFRFLPATEPALFCPSLWSHRRSFIESTCVALRYGHFSQTSSYWLNRDLFACYGSLMSSRRVITNSTIALSVKEWRQMRWCPQLYGVRRRYRNVILPVFECGKYIVETTGAITSGGSFRSYDIDKEYLKSYIDVNNINILLIWCFLQRVFYDFIQKGVFNNGYAKNMILGIVGVILFFSIQKQRLSQVLNVGQTLLFCLSYCLSWPTPVGRQFKLSGYTMSKSNKLFWISAASCRFCPAILHPCK